MKFDKFFEVWGIAPFGGDNSVEPNQAPPAGTPNPDNSGNPQGGQGNSGQQQNPPGGTPPANSGDNDDDDPYEGLSAKELKRLLNDTEKNKTQAEKDRDAAKAKLDEAERAKLSKEQALEKDLEDERTANALLRKTNESLAITQSILSDKRFEWHNPEVVAGLLNREIVKVDDKGNVDGITKELARIAKDHAYLLKTKQSQQNNEQNNGPTGFQPGQGGAGSGNGLPNAAELAKTYPALASRI